MDIDPYALVGAGPGGGIQTHEPRGPEPRVLSTELHPDVVVSHMEKSRYNRRNLT